jgi:hypothetical protein
MVRHCARTPQSPSNCFPGRLPSEPAALRAEAREKLVSDRCDVGDADRRKWESDRSSGVADHDPAVDELLPQAMGDLVRAAALDRWPDI